MKKRNIVMAVLIAFLSFGICDAKAFAETNINETILCTISHYDTKAEYKVEITDQTDKKIIMRFKDLTMIESYVENNHGRSDLKSLSEISYSDSKEKYFITIEDITDSAYQLDCEKQYQYTIYVNNELKKEVKAQSPHINGARSDAENIYCVFYVDYDKVGIASDQTYEFGEKVYKVTFVLFLLLCVYMKFYGTRLRQSKKHGGIVNEKNIDYCRELPDYIDIETAYASLYYCSKISTKKIKNGIIGAFLLKWSRDDNVFITDNGNRVFCIDLKDGDFKKTELEQELYDMLKKAAGSNNKIDNTELKDWSRRNKSDLEKWHDALLSSPFNENLKPEAEALLGLKKFLLDYSLIDERKHIEVKVWEHYLIYAQLLGIADEVNKQFAKIYPDYSKIGQLSVMNLNDLAFEYLSVRLFLIAPMGLALVFSMIASLIYYIIKLL